MIQVYHVLYDIFSATIVPSLYHYRTFGRFNTRITNM